MRTIVLKYGFIAGAIVSVLMFIAMTFHDEIGLDRSLVVGYANMVLAFLMTYVGIKTYRDTIAGGRVRFGKALQVGLLISLIATCCYVATWEIIYFTMMPDFAEKYAATAIEQARAKGASAAELASTTAAMAQFTEQYKNPLVNMAYTFLEPLPVALLFSVVSAWLLSRKPAVAPAVT